MITVRPIGNATWEWRAARLVGKAREDERRGPPGETRLLERHEQVWVTWRREWERERQRRDLREGLQALAVFAAYALVAWSVAKGLQAVAVFAAYALVAYSVASG